MTTRPLNVIDVPWAGAAVDSVTDALRRALSGDGPALAPVDPSPAAAPTSSDVPGSGHIWPSASEPVPSVMFGNPDDRGEAGRDVVERDDVAVVLPTSGSTGAPNGVLLTADALWHSARATHARLGGPGRWLLALPPTRVAGLMVLVRSLDAGRAPVVLADKLTGDAFAAATARLGDDSPRYTSLVPTQLSRLLDAGGAARAALASYDAVLIGGAATSPALYDRAAEAGVRIVCTYGMTETCGGCVYDGYPLDGVRLRIDADGRVNIAGPTVFAGYHKRPDLTAERLVDGWHVTADLGELEPDGRLRVLGRVDDVVVSGGVNVPLPAVERCLAVLPQVAEAVAVGVPDPEWGERVVAYLVPRPGADPVTLEQARDHVAAHHPRAYAPREIIVVSELPTLPSGKPDRLRLRAQAAGQTG